MAQIGNKLVRKQRVVESLFKRTKKSLGESKNEYRKLSNYLEVGQEKLDRSPDITERQLNKLKNLKIGGDGLGDPNSNKPIRAGGLLDALLFGAGAIDTIRNIRNFAKGVGKKFFGKNASKNISKTTSKSVSKVVAKEVTEEVTEKAVETGVKTTAKNVTKEGIEAASKTLAKESVEKVATKSGSKLLAKKIPLVGLVLGTAFAVDRAAKGDMAGAAMEFLSGAASTVPGWGTAASVAIDAGLIAKDVKEAVDDASSDESKETTTSSDTDISSTSDDVSNVNYEPQSTMLQLQEFDRAVNLFGEKFGTITADNFMSSIDREVSQVSDIQQVSSGDGSMNLGEAAESLKGLSSNRPETDGGRNGCVWAVNQVYKKAGITPPWGNSLYVPTAESKMIEAGYTEVAYGDRQAGDIMVMYDNHATEPQAHIGVVLKNGNVLSNSSGKAALSWEASPESYNNYYGNVGKIYRRPGTVAKPDQKESKEDLQQVDGNVDADSTVATTETPPTDVAALAQEGEIRKKVIPKTSVRGRDKTVYQRFDGEQWLTGTGETAANYKELYERQEYLKSEQGIANEGAGQPLQITPPSGESIFTVPSELADQSNFVSQYTSYNHPSKMVNNTTLISMGSMPGNKQPMVVQAPGGGSSTAIIPSSDAAAALRLSQIMLFNKLVS